MGNHSTTYSYSEAQGKHDEMKQGRSLRQKYWWTKRLVPVLMSGDTLNGFPMCNHLKQ